MKRRRWFEIHSWIGIVTGLVMFLICWSGTVAVFSHEIDRWLDPRLTVEPTRPTAGWQAWYEGVLRRLPDATAVTLHAPEAPGAAVVAVVDTPEQAMQRVFLDPASGEVLGQSSYFNVQRFFRSLHMSLFDFGSDAGYGYWFVGAFGVLLLVSSLAPLIFYRRWWRGFFTLKTGRGSRVFWSDAHKLIGVWALAFSLLIALTGVWYLVEWLDVDFGYPERAPVERAEPASLLSLDELVAQAESAWPGLRVTSVTPHVGSYWGNVVHLEGQGAAWLVRERANFVRLDPGTGEIVQQQRAENVGWPARWVDTADPLHFGNFDGLAIKSLWFVLGLGLCGLCLTGAYLHAQRLTANGPRARWRGTRTALLITLAVLMLTVWAGAQEIRGYGPAEGDSTAWPEVPGAVVTFLAAWCAATIGLLGLWVWFVLRARPELRGRTASNWQVDAQALADNGT